MRKLQLVLDSNEYLFTFSRQPKLSSESLLEKIISKPEEYKIRASRTILEEVRRNASPERFKDFWSFLQAAGVSIDEDWEVPFELGAKYESMGLKRGDAFIAAYTEWTDAEYLITENRDFTILTLLPFRVLRAEEFLKKHLH